MKHGWAASGTRRANGKVEEDPMQHDRLRVWTGFFLVSTIWGSTWLAIKVGLDSMPPFLAAGLRFSVASLILLALVTIRRVPVPMTTEARKLYGTLGVLSFSLPFALVYWGQQFIPSGLSSILFAAYPLWVALFSHLFLPSERLDVYTIAGVIVGFAGLVVIFSGDLHWSDPHAAFGMAAVLLSTMVQAYALIAVKKYGQAVSPYAMNLMGMAVGAVLLLIASFVAESDASVQWNAAALGSIAYLAVFGSVIAFGTYYWLLKRTRAVYLSLTTFLNPIVAVLLGAVILGEALATSVFAGAAMVFAGILVANGRHLRARTTEPS
jgi:drug/metabolite transporter (DMT)-like permease